MSQLDIAGNLNGDFVQGGNALFPYPNNRDLLICANEMVASGQGIFAVPDSDQANRCGFALQLIGTASTPIIDGANGSGWIFGSQIPATKIRFYMLAKTNTSLTFSPLVEVGVGSTPLCQTGTNTLTTSYQLFSCDVDATAYAGQSPYLNLSSAVPGAGNTVSIGWVAWRPEPQDLEVNGPVTATSLINPNGTILDTFLSGYNGNSSGTNIPYAVPWTGSSAGAAVCPDVNGNLTVTGCTGATAGVSSVNSHAGALQINFSAGAGSCAYSTGTTTCTVSGSGSGGGSVTNFIASSWPAWLTPTVATSTTTPTLSVTATTGLTANQFLATPNGTTGAVTPRLIVAADLPTLNTTIDNTACTLTSSCSPPSIVSKTTTTAVTIGSTLTKQSFFNQEASAAAAVTYTLPTPVAGMIECVKNSNSSGTPDTGVLELLVANTGTQSIENNGVVSSSGYITSPGAAGDGGCVQAISTTQWEFYQNGGTTAWTIH